MMKKLLLTFFALLFLSLSSCGYSIDGFTTFNGKKTTVLGDGTQTLQIKNVEHVTMYPGVSYYIRSIARDEINLRRIATWVPIGEEPDLYLDINMSKFLVRSSVTNSVDNTLLSTTTTALELIFRKATNNKIVWRSGVVSYSDTYETVVEDDAIKEGLKEALRRALDRLEEKDF